MQGKPVSGYVRITQVQAAYLGSGNAGSGVLYYQGSRYPFSVGGQSNVQTCRFASRSTRRRRDALLSGCDASAVYRAAEDAHWQGNRR